MKALFGPAAWCLVLLVAPAIALGKPLPAPTGPHAVGRRVLRFIDESRPEVLGSANQHREVVVWLWYPASPASGSTPAPYLDDLDQLSKALSSGEVSIARSTQTSAASNAPLAAEPARLPVILFSPGTDTTAALYSSLCEDLASHGYLVAAVDHPYDVRAVLLSDGRVIKQARQPDGGEPLLQFLRERATVRAQDLRFVLDRLTRMQDGAREDPLRGRLDLAHVAAFGHSTGGMVAAEFCRIDARVRACGNLDGLIAALPAYTDQDGAGPRQPFLFMEKPLPPMKGEKPEQKEGRLAFLRQRGNAVLAGVTTGRSVRVTITGATHASFSDEEVLTGDSARQRDILGFVRRYLGAFFDETLRDERAALFDAAPPDSAIRVQVFTAKN